MFFKSKERKLAEQVAAFYGEHVPAFAINMEHGEEGLCAYLTKIGIPFYHEAHNHTVEWSVPPVQFIGFHANFSDPQQYSIVTTGFEIVDGISVAGKGNPPLDFLVMYGIQRPPTKFEQMLVEELNKLPAFKAFTMPGR